MSPAAADGLVVVLIGTNDDGAIAAYDAANGTQKWIWKGDGPAYASPLITDFGGAKQVITLTQKYVVGLQLQTGEQLWRIDFPERPGMNIPSPVRVDNHVIVASTAGTYALAPALTSGAWAAPTVWHNPELSMRFSTPVRKGNLLFGFSNRNSGMFFCADVTTGKTLWTSEPRQGDNAVVYLSGEQLMLLKNDGELIIAAATEKAFTPIRRYQVADSNTYANPLFFDQGILIKDETTLALLSWK
jgi:outer membrane protein assembly factor BamB